MRHIVIDGSDAMSRAEIERYCSDAGVEYHWKSPEGIYAAMSAGLDLLAEGDWVWFLNATDVLSNRKAIEAVASALERESIRPRQSWIAGKTVILWRGAPYEMPFVRNPRTYAFLLRRGLIGLAHPSTVMKVEALREVNPFESSAEVSEDYRIGIEMLKRGNYPSLIDSNLSIYDQTGFSAQFPVRTLLSKAKARVRTFGLRTIPFEPIPLSIAALRFLLRKLANLSKNDRWLLATGLKASSMNIPADEHLCGTSASRWPNCCLDHLYTE